MSYAACRHQAIMGTNVDFSLVGSCGIHLKAISQEMIKISILEMSLQITNLRSQLYLPGVNELFQLDAVWHATVGRSTDGSVH